MKIQTVQFHCPPPPSGEKIGGKTYAQRLVIRAIARGDLLRGSCCNCGAVKTHAHHEDYTKPNVIVWLCSSCHRLRHSELGWGCRNHAFKHPLDDGARKIVSISLPPEMVEQIRDRCAQLSRSRSNYVEMLIVNDIAHAAKP